MNFLLICSAIGLPLQICKELFGLRIQFLPSHSTAPLLLCSVSKISSLLAPAVSGQWIIMTLLKCNTDQHSWDTTPCSTPELISQISSAPASAVSIKFREALQQWKKIRLDFGIWTWIVTKYANCYWSIRIFSTTSSLLG